MLARASENVNANWNQIVPALKLDKRIGKHAYLKPGLGISLEILREICSQ